MTLEHKYNALGNKIDEIIALPLLVKGKDEESRLFIESIKENLVNDIVPFIVENWIDTNAKNKAYNWQNDNFLEFLVRQYKERDDIIACLTSIRTNCAELESMAKDIGTAHRAARFPRGQCSGLYLKAF